MDTVKKFWEWCRERYDGMVGLAIVISALIMLLALGSQLSISVADLTTGFSADQAALGLREEVASVKSMAESFAAGDLVRNAILSPQGSAAYQELFKITDGLEGERFILTNSLGRVLTRINSPASNDDFTYERTPWGRAIASNKEFVSIERTYLTPLIIVGGLPVGESFGKNIGSVTALRPMDERFANRFEDRYLPEGVETVFYDNSGSYVSDSFEAESTKKLLNSYIVENGGMLGDRTVSWARTLVLDGKMYATRNIPIYSSDGKQVGGMLLFVPSSPFTASVTIAALLSLVVFVIEVGLRRNKFKKKNQPIADVEIRGAIVALAYFIVLASAFFYIINSVATKVSEPQQAIYNSTIAFLPETNTYRVGQAHLISATVDSGGEKINAIQIEVKYDPAAIRVENIDLDKSICDPNIVIERTIDNERGVLSVQCGTNPTGFAGRDGNLMDIIVVPLRAGQFSLAFGSNSRILASDGLGTDVLREAIGGWYQAIVPDSRPGEDYTSIYSTTHPNPLQSYAADHIEVNWGVARGYGYRYSLDSSPAGIPQGSFRATSSAQFDAPGDGTFYFHIQSSGPGGLSGVTSYPINIDSTSPPAPIVRVSDTNIPVGYVVRIEMENADAVPSHKDGFYVMIDDGILLPASSPLYVPFISPGEHRLVVHVFDVAGNENSTTVKFLVRN
jgi:hypothetical protein